MPLMLDVLSCEALPASENAPLILMVSGGSDSTALLVRASRGELDLRDGQGPRRLGRARLAVLHINHLIRGEASDADESFVRSLCAELGVACHVRRIDVPAILERDGGNLEEVARMARYQAAWELAQELAAAAQANVRQARVLVAHTADDRAETFLMRAMTGAGAGALAGLRPTRGLVVRPLLGETREDLRAYLREQQVGWREDATNDEDEALRSYVRHHVTPPIRRRCPAFAQVLSRSLDIMGEEDDLLEHMAAEVVQRAAREVPSGYCNALTPPLHDPAPQVPLSPRELRRMRRAVCLDISVLAQESDPLMRRVLRQALASLLGQDGARQARVEARHVAWLVSLVRQGSDTCNLPLGIRGAVREGKLLIEVPLPQVAGTARSARDVRRSEGAAGAPGNAVASEPAVCLPVPGRAAWGGRAIVADLVEVPPQMEVRSFVRAQIAELARACGRTLVEGRDVAFVDAQLAGVVPPGARICEPVEQGALWVRGARAGERMRPFGLHGHTKLVFDVLMEAGVPAEQRLSSAVVCAGDALAPSSQTSPVSCGGVVWVAGIRVDERVAYTNNTPILLRLQFVSD